jgi:hypothetical protein
MRRGVLRRFLLSALAGLALVCGQLVPAQPVQAASFNPSDYFTYTYTIALSRSHVQNGEVFYASVSGSATCIKDAPVRPDEAFIRGRVIALHLESGARVALNAGYSATISPVPSIKGEVFTDVQQLPLYFPWDAPAGKYSVTGELIEARVKAGLWFDVTDSFPPTQDMGTAYYRVPEPAPVIPTPGVPEPPATETPPAPTVEPSTPVPPATAPVPDPGQPPTGTPTQEPGVSPPVAPPVPQGALSLGGLTDAAGRLKSGLEVSSGDGLCNLAVDPPASISNAGAEPSDWLMVLRQTQAPAAGGDFQLVGSAYAVLPGNAFFDPGARLTVGYYPAMLPPGMDEARLLMARWDTGSRHWIVLSGSLIDPAANTVSSVIQQADVYTLLAAVSPPRFEISHFAISPITAAPGEMVSVQCRVTNSGSITGYYELVLVLDGKAHEVSRLALEGGASYTVNFGVVREAPGVYAVELNGQSGAFTVSGSRYSYSSVPPEESTPGTAPGVIYWVQIIYGLNLVLLGVIFWLSRKWLGRQYESLKKRMTGK